MSKIRYSRKPSLLEHPLTLFVLTAVACTVDFMAMRGTIAGIGFLTNPFQVTLVTLALSMFMDIVIGCIVFDRMFRTKKAGTVGVAVMAVLVAACFLLHMYGIHFGSVSDTGENASSLYMQTAQNAAGADTEEIPLSEKAFRSLLSILPILTTMLIGILTIHRKDYELNHRIEKYEIEIEMIDVFTQRMKQFVESELDDVYDKARLQLSVSAETSRVKVKNSKSIYRKAVADACPYANAAALFRNQLKPTPTVITVADPAETGTLLEDSSFGKHGIGTSAAAGLSLHEDPVSVQEPAAEPAKPAEPAPAEPAAVITDVSFSDVTELAETRSSIAAAGVEPDE